jgi:hypothetical protein
MKIAVVEKFLWSWRRGRVWLGCRLKISFLEKRQAGKTIFRPQPPFKAAAPPLLFGIRHCFDKLSLCFRSLRSRLSLLWLPPPLSCSTYGNARGVARCRVPTVLRPQCPAFHGDAVRP